VVADPVVGPQDPRLGDGASAAAPASAHERPARDLERSAEELGVAGFTRLAFSRREAEAILALVPRQEAFGALGLAASRDTVVSGDLSGYRILHFATHALLHPSHPELSGLVLSLVDERGRPRDGFLRAHEIRDLVLPADLVVLSACRTAVGPEVRGEGPLSLARSFLDAGAARAIVTLWSVNDEASAELMRRFYRGVLADRLRPPEALRAAQLSMAGEERWQAAYYWAPYVFLGEWR
jgi:CHAT domain-containing protein